MKPAPIIAVKEARKILGKSYENLTDEQVAALIRQLDGIVEAYIKSVPKESK